jgi:hypothetical protein
VIGITAQVSLYPSPESAGAGIGEAHQILRECAVEVEQDAVSTLQRVYPNHCSGEAAFVALTQILGLSVVRPCPVGTFLEF